METTNADLPSWMTHTSMEDHIAAMAVPESMAGEQHLIASSKALVHPFFVLNTDNKVMQTYGGKKHTASVQFQRIGEDIGLYTCSFEQPATEVCG